MAWPPEMRDSRWDPVFYGVPKNIRQLLEHLDFDETKSTDPTNVVLGRVIKFCRESGLSDHEIVQALQGCQDYVDNCREEVQAAYDHMRDGVLAQGCISSDVGSCLLVGNRGERCNIGHLLSFKEYGEGLDLQTLELEGPMSKSVARALKLDGWEFLGSGSCTAGRFLSDAVTAHDWLLEFAEEDHMPLYRKNMLNIASKWGLQAE